MSQTFPPVNLSTATVGTSIPFSWSQAVVRPTLSQLQQGLSEHLELYNASMHTLTISLNNTTVTFTMVPQSIKRIALPNTTDSLQIGPVSILQTSGLNSLIVTYYMPSESQETFTVTSAPPSTGGSTSLAQVIRNIINFGIGIANSVSVDLVPTAIQTAYLTDLFITFNMTTIGQPYLLTIGPTVGLQIFTGYDISESEMRHVNFSNPISTGVVGGTVRSTIATASGNNFAVGGYINAIGYVI